MMKIQKFLDIYYFLDYYLFMLYYHLLLGMEETILSGPKKD